MKKRGLKANANKSKVMVLGREEGSICEFKWMVGNWNMFKYLGFGLD